MHQYIFVLGRSFLLSSAEILSLLKALSIEYSIKGNSEEVLLIETQTPLNLEILQSSLGGTIQIGELENIVDRKIGRKIRREKGLIKANLNDQYIVIGNKKTEQDVEDFRKREFDRPYRDPKSGQLSVKLALMMVNLATQSDTGTIYDPFCGSGTVNIEATRLGFNTIGSDISYNALIGARKNMEWYRKEVHNPEVRFPAYHFFRADIKNAIDEIKEKEYLIDNIVTEGYLGKPRKKPFLNTKAEKDELEKVSDLIEASLIEYRKILKKGRRIAIVIPAYRGLQDTIYLPIRDKIEKLGYNTVDLFGKDFNLLDKETKLLIYRRGSFVLREIFVLETK